MTARKSYQALVKGQLNLDDTLEEAEAFGKEQGFLAAHHIYKKNTPKAQDAAEAYFKKTFGMQNLANSKKEPAATITATIINAFTEKYSKTKNTPPDDNSQRLKDWNHKNT